ncbi:conserved Plasmodium protein, unknown function [Plasmodium sp. gorilla clade G3]|nr:conserved Plasmodium protein, unknown function [Plasmodium sp. gorilla clade G3]
MKIFFLCFALLFVPYKSIIITLNNDNAFFVFPNIMKKNRNISKRNFTTYMKRLRNASVEIDLVNRKDLTKVEVIKMFLKGVKECKNVEYLKEKHKGHVPPTTKRKLMKQKRMINLRAQIKNTRLKKQEQVPEDKNILNFPADQIKNINAAVLYFKKYFEKYENNNDSNDI